MVAKVCGGGNNLVTVKSILVIIYMIFNFSHVPPHPQAFHSQTAGPQSISLHHTRLSLSVARLTSLLICSPSFQPFLIP